MLKYNIILQAFMLSIDSWNLMIENGIFNTNFCLALGKVQIRVPVEKKIITYYKVLTWPESACLAHAGIPVWAEGPDAETRAHGPEDIAQAQASAWCDSKYAGWLGAQKLS